VPSLELIRRGPEYRFPERINLQVARAFSHGLMHDLDKGLSELRLDFSETEKAYTEGMLPLVCALDMHRDRLERVDVALPQSPLRAVFLTRNWAHLLAPTSYLPDERRHDGYLPARRFENHEGLTRGVDQVMDLVLQSLELPRDVLAALEWSLNEIGDNVLNHAECETGGFLQMETLVPRNELAFTVSDAGRGVLASMISSGRHRLGDDVEAIGEAVKQGVTRDPNAGQGNGLAGSLRIAAASGGSLNIISGRGYFSVFTDEESGEPQNRVGQSPQRFHGTVVHVRIGMDKNFVLEDALAFQGVPYYPDDIIDIRYTNRAEDLELRLADHSVGFGTRRAGRGVRTKLKNLLDAAPQKRLIVDCEGVPSISSSFADEVFGKLFSSMGPLAFGSRLQLVRMDELVRRLVDMAIVQRVVQETGPQPGTPAADETPEALPATSDDQALSRLAELLDDGELGAAGDLLNDLGPRRSQLSRSGLVEFRRLLVRFYTERGWEALEQGDQRNGFRAFKLAAETALKLYGKVPVLNEASVNQLADVRHLGEALVAAGEPLHDEVERLRGEVAALASRSSD
jgi:hypothetical protein